VDDDELVKLYNPAAKSHNASHLTALRAVYERGVEDGRASMYDQAYDDGYWGGFASVRSDS